MKHLASSRRWLAALSIGSFLACSGKLNVGQGTDQPGASAGSSGTLGGHAAGGNGSGGGSGKPPITNGGNPATCPATMPMAGDSCDLERAACGYGPATGSPDLTYTQCVCGERAVGDLRWDCTAIGASFPSCPTSVENGSSCFGHYATECWYPVSVYCACNQDPGVWSCRRTGQPWDVPAAPTTPDPETPINTLSDADRTAWCQWYQDAVFGPGFPPIADSEVGPDGRTLTSSCSYTYGAACNVAIVMLSPKQCAQNLAASQCAAPIGNLTDCVTTARSECLPSPHGCARYLAEGCSRTIVSDLGPPGAGEGLPAAGSAATPTAGSAATPTAGTGSSTGGARSGLDFSSPCSVQVE